MKVLTGNRPHVRVIQDEQPPVPKPTLRPSASIPAPGTEARTATQLTQFGWRPAQRRISAPPLRRCCSVAPTQRSSGIRSCIAAVPAGECPISGRFAEPQWKLENPLPCPPTAAWPGERAFRTKTTQRRRRVSTLRSHLAVGRRCLGALMIHPVDELAFGRASYQLHACWDWRLSIFCCVARIWAPSALLALEGMTGA
jgi:hypothetical protein